jgi:hypothetical protein
MSPARHFERAIVENQTNLEPNLCWRHFIAQFDAVLKSYPAIGNLRSKAPPGMSTAVA